MGYEGGTGKTSSKRWLNALLNALMPSFNLYAVKKLAYLCYATPKVLTS